MLIVMIILLVLMSCVYTIFLFGLAKASKRADDAEEKFLSIIMSQKSSINGNLADNDLAGDKTSLKIAEKTAV